jgi:hypothetical protein
MYLYPLVSDSRHIRGFEHASDHLSPEKQARHASGAQLSWLEAELAFCLVILGSIAVALFFTAGPVGKALMIIPGLLAAAAIVRFAVRAGERGPNDFRSEQPPNLKEAELSEDSRRKAMQEFRFRK